MNYEVHQMRKYIISTIIDCMDCFISPVIRYTEILIYLKNKSGLGHVTGRWCVIVFTAKRLILDPIRNAM